MNAEDRGRSRGDHALDLLRIDRVAAWLDIAEYRGDLLPLECMGRGDEGERRHDHFPLQPERPGSDFEGDRAVTHRDRVPASDLLGDLGFELVDVRTIVGEPTTVEDFSNAL